MKKAYILIIVFKSNFDISFNEFMNLYKKEPSDLFYTLVRNLGKLDWGTKIEFSQDILTVSMTLEKLYFNEILNVEKLKSVVKQERSLKNTKFIYVLEDADMQSYKIKCAIAYDKACALADDYIEKYNFCGIEKRYGCLYCKGTFSTYLNLCCSGCKYIGPEGCTTRSIGCLVSYCYLNESPMESDLTDSDTAEKEYEEMRKLSRKEFIPVLPFHGQLQRWSFEDHWENLLSEKVSILFKPNTLTNSSILKYIKRNKK